jgi:malonyl-CoA O-methyltransferase
MSRLPILEPAEAYALWAPSYPAHAHNPVMQAEERAMLGLMPTELGELAVLDAGCGSGRYMLHALRRGAARVSGVDLSPAMLDRARTELGGFQHGAKVELAGQLGCSTGAGRLSRSDGLQSGHWTS